MQQIPLDTRILRSSQEIPSNPMNLQGWSQGASLPPNENALFQAEEAQLGEVEYLSPNTGFPSEEQPRTYPSEDGLWAHNASLMLQQLRQGKGSLFQQVEAAYQEPRADLLGQFTMYQREDLQFSQGAQHGPYIRDDPALQFSPSELGFMPFNIEAPEPEPRELAVQNAKAYLLQTSIKCDLSL